jgi:hypothetical protein
LRGRGEATLYSPQRRYHADGPPTFDRANLPLGLSNTLRQYGCFLRLTKASEEKPFRFVADYIRIDGA